MVALALAWNDCGSAGFQWIPAVLCLLFAFIMQIDANLINDFFDFVNGTDNSETRLGPRRACAQGWVKLDSIDDSFEVQAEIRKALDEWLDPVSHKGHDGWEIGVLPKASQVLMHLNAARNLALVQRIALIAHYTDAEGEHETDVEGLTASPFMVCRSGKHQVYTNY